MDFIHHAVFIEEPDFIAPFFRVSMLVAGIVIVGQVFVAKIRVEGRHVETWMDGHFGDWWLDAAEV